MQWLPKEQSHGFERLSGSALPWQMVPRGGARGLKLVEAKGLEIKIEAIAGSSSARGGLTYTETKVGAPANREIWLQGHIPGRYLVSAARSGVPVAPLEAEVFAGRVVKIAFYMHSGPSWNVRKLTEMANVWWQLQANVRLEVVGEWTNDSATNSLIFNGPVDLSRNDHRTALQEYGNHWSANLLVYFGTHAQEGGRLMNAQTGGNKTYINAMAHVGKKGAQDYTRMARTLAHEIGHFICRDLSHDGKQTDLMFSDNNKNPGTQIRRDRVRKVTR
jgi:hypothetical protein